MFIFSTFSILQFAKVSLERPIFRRTPLDLKLNELRQYELIRKEEIVNELWVVTVFTFFILLFLIAIFTWIGSYFVIKPIDENIKSKEQFLEHSSHELRTPLAILHSDLELSINENSIESLKNTNINALAEVKRLQNLSNILLNDLSDTKSEINLNSLCNEIVTKLNKINTNNIQFKITGERTQKLHHQKMYNILFNVLDNSLKYSKPDSTVTIDINEKMIKISNPTEIKNIKPSTGLSIVNKLAYEQGFKTSFNLNNGNFIFKLYSK